jgi:hypothetical protein
MKQVVDTMAKIVGLPLVQRTPTKFLLLTPPITASYSVAEAVPSERELGGEGRAEKKDILEQSLRAALGDQLQVFTVEKIYILGYGGGVNSHAVHTDPSNHDAGGITKRLGVTDIDGCKRGRGLAFGHSTFSSKTAIATSPARRSTIALSLNDSEFIMKPTLEYSFIRRRTQHGFSVYGHTMVRKLTNGERTETKRIITKREYHWLKDMYADQSRYVVVQRRYCFVENKRVFSLHKYLEPRSDICILHRQGGQHRQEEANEIDGGVEEKVLADFPPFLRVGAPLDEDGIYSAYRLSLKPRLRSKMAEENLAKAAAMPPKAKSIC